MQTKTLTIINKLGLHARASAKFVAAASQFSSKIEVTKDDKVVNGKSIMGVMMLGANKGSEIQIIIEGDDEQQAMNAIEELIQKRFDEAE